MADALGQVLSEIKCLSSYILPEDRDFVVPSDPTWNQAAKQIQSQGHDLGKSLYPAPPSPLGYCKPTSTKGHIKKLYKKQKGKLLEIPHLLDTLIKDGMLVTSLPPNVKNILTCISNDWLSMNGLVISA